MLPSLNPAAAVGIEEEKQTQADWVLPSPLPETCDSPSLQSNIANVDICRWGRRVVAAVAAVAVVVRGRRVVAVVAVTAVLTVVAVVAVTVV